MLAEYSTEDTKVFLSSSSLVGKFKTKLLKFKNYLMVIIDILLVFVETQASSVKQAVCCPPTIL